MEISKPNNIITAASITLIRSPNYPASFDYSRLIKRYFSKPRFLTEGQVFSINSSLDFRFHERLQNELFITWPVIYWKVTKLEPFTRGYVVKSETSLSQAGATQAFLHYKHSNTTDIDRSDSFNLIAALEKTNYFSTYRKELLALLEPIINKSLDFISTTLIHGRSGCGKRILLELAAKSLDIHLYRIDANELIGDNASTTEAKIKTALLKASTFTPCLIHIAKIDLFCHLEDLDLERVEQNFLDVISSLNIARSTWPIAIVATSCDFDLINKSPLSSIFHSNFHMKCLDKTQLEDMLKVLMEHSLKYGLDTIDSFMEELSQTDLMRMRMQTGNVIDLLAKFDIQLLSLKDEKSDMKESKEAAKRAIQMFTGMRQTSTGRQQLSQANLSDVGGMSHVKKQIADAIRLPNDYPQLRRPSGLLLYGPPGTGKTLLAKAVANECKLNFISVKGPELINMYVGESEQNIRNLFQKAREQAPSVIFFDEFDSIAPNRGQSGDSGGLADRVVSQILAEMGSITEDENQVFVIAATNRVDLIDKNFLRPGRFDKVIEVPLPSEPETRLDILTALTRKMNLDDNVDLAEIEQGCPLGMSGADFYSVCANAMKMALMNCVQQITSGLKVESECDIVITQEDLLKAVSEFINK